VHRRTVSEALGSPVPAPRKRPEGWPAPALGEYRELVDEWLVADQTAPRKQRHTAHRVWRRLVDERGADVSERQVRRRVRERRLVLGGLVEEAFVPLVHEPGWRLRSTRARLMSYLAGPADGALVLDALVLLGRLFRTGAHP
jgi:hypothetical protein